MKKKIFIITSFIIILITTIYANSFKDIELVCNKNKNEEYFLLNYIFKKDLKHKIKLHNENFKMRENEYTRVYLKNPIFKITDPIFNDDYNYKKEGCNKVDNMDIYCEAFFRKGKKGKIEIKYRFYE